MMAGSIMLWVLAFAAGLLLGYFNDPQVKEERLDAAHIHARKARLAYIQHALLLSSLSNGE